MHLLRACNPFAKPKPAPTWLLPKSFLGGLFSWVEFFHWELCLKRRNHSLCLLTLRGGYKGRLFSKCWEVFCFLAMYFTNRERRGHQCGGVLARWTLCVQTIGDQWPEHGYGDRLSSIWGWSDSSSRDWGIGSPLLSLMSFTRFFQPS